MAIDSDIYTQAYAQAQDERNPLRHLRSQFIIPSKADLKREGLPSDQDITASSEDECIYLCGNSLGVQPKAANEYVNAQLKTWATKGVHGHFYNVKNSPLKPWLHMDEQVAAPMARVVGAKTDEVAVMQTLTANLHLAMASFYRPTQQRYKIILEGHAFPSDHYVVESQLAHHEVTQEDAMVLIEPPTSESPLLPTEHILATIDAHAESTALLLLPGVQYYSGQLFEIERITAYAHSKGLVVGWDLAHAAGNVPMKLHDWNVDFAVWCTYKYLNSGPGAYGGLFVHEKHTPSPAQPTDSSTPTTNGTRGTQTYKPRLTGWWGENKTSRFNMANKFDPIPGARGFQLSNPSALDLSSVAASLSVFDQTNMDALREKSVDLTGYAEELITRGGLDGKPYSIITSRKPEERGAQLSVKLEPGLLGTVYNMLEDQGVVVDQRKPDVIRVAPAPLYNSWEDVWKFNEIFQDACKKAVVLKDEGKTGDA